jgi:hypothetical protein
MQETETGKTRSEMKVNASSDTGVDVRQYTAATLAAEYGSILP